jgi:hypothetical protein
MFGDADGGSGREGDDGSGGLPDSGRASFGVLSDVQLAAGGVPVQAGLWGLRVFFELRGLLLKG